MIVCSSVRDAVAPDATLLRLTPRAVSDGLNLVLQPVVVLRDQIARDRSAHRVTRCG